MGRHMLETNILSNADKAHIRGTENFPSWPTLQMKYILIQRNTFKRAYQGLSWYTHKSLVVKYSSSRTGWMTEQSEESMWRNIWSKWCNQQLHPLISFFLLCCGCSLNVCFQFSVGFFLRKITNISEKKYRCRMVLCFLWPERRILIHLLPKYRVFSFVSLLSCRLIVLWLFF